MTLVRSISHFTTSVASRRFFAAALSLLVLALAGCSTFPIRKTPARTMVRLDATELPARLVSNFFIVDAKQADGRSYRFLIDTGSSATLVSPDVAAALKLKDKNPAKPVRVRSANGVEVELEPVTLRRLQLGAARFDRVPALVHDFGELSAHLGLPIDGLIGFPVFRDALLTLDYPRGRLVIAPYPVSAPAAPRQSDRVSTISFNNERNTPIIPVQMGNESFMVLIDSGSDGGLHLNPVGLHPKFAAGPRPGKVVSSLAGDRTQMVGRLGQDILLGSHVIDDPVVDLTDQLSAIGGELLKHFSLTFDQHRSTVTFVRNTDGVVRMEPRRDTGLSFSRGGSYWRVMTVVPDTPTATLPVQSGDLCVRINGEPVFNWDYERYATLIAKAAKVTYTFLAGTREYDLEIPVFELVP
jgi:hypothetical protein